MKKLLLLVFLILLLSNCKNDNGATNCEAISCTAVFVTLVVSVEDTTGMPVPLDRFEVLDKNSLQDISIELSNSSWLMAQQNGQYPIYEDSFLIETRNIKRPLIFRGFIDNQEVLNAEYTVTANCCHVSIASGDTKIILN